MLIDVRERNEIGGYRIVKKIGFGGMSTVFEATDHGGQRVALKLLHPSISADPAARDRLRREVRTLRQVTGPYVAQVVDAETEEDDAFIVTELIDGPTLSADVKDNGAYEGKDLADLSKELADALVAIHSKGVLHRDLKPSNVMMSDRGPVLIDFGIAQVAEESRLTATGLIAHTPGYCAPEILNGEDPTEAADWWSWAATLAFAATGHAPFGSGHSPKVTRKVLTGEAELGEIDPVVAYALGWALTPQASKRPTPATVIGMLDGSIEVSDEELELGPTVLRREVREPEPQADTIVPGLPAPTEVRGYEEAPPSYPTESFEPPPYREPNPTEHMPIQVRDPYPSPWETPAEPRYPSVRQPGEVPAWLVPPRKRPGICLALWLAFVAWSGAFPFMAIAVFTGLHLIAAISGSSWEALNRARIVRGGRFRSESVHIAGRLPISIISGTIHTVASVGSGIVVGGGLAWLLTTISTWPAPVPIAIGAAVGSALAWVYPTSGGTRKVTRQTLGVIAPSVGYSLFWVVLAIALMSLAIAMYSSGDIPDWAPWEAPSMFKMNP